MCPIINHCHVSSLRIHSFGAGPKDRREKMPLQGEKKRTREGKRGEKSGRGRGGEEERGSGKGKPLGKERERLCNNNQECHVFLQEP